MKKINLVKGAAIFSMLSLAAYGLVSANTASALTATSVATGTVKTNNFVSGHKPGRGHTIKLTAAQITERAAKMTAIKTALNAGNYSDWVTAIKNVNSNSPLLTQITSDKFLKYSEAIKLREQSNTIMAELGIKEFKGVGRHLEN